jgi:hypothetical protein
MVPNLVTSFNRLCTRLRLKGEGGGNIVSSILSRLGLPTTI